MSDPNETRARQIQDLKSQYAKLFERANVIGAASGRDEGETVYDILALKRKALIDMLGPEEAEQFFRSVCQKR